LQPILFFIPVLFINGKYDIRKKNISLPFPKAVLLLVRQYLLQMQNNIAKENSWQLIDSKLFLIPVATSVQKSSGSPESQCEEEGTQYNILPPKDSHDTYFLSFFA